MTPETPEAVGQRVGRAIARDALAEFMPPVWSGLDGEDGDQLTEAGIEPDTPEWKRACAAARRAFHQFLADYHGDHV